MRLVKFSLHNGRDIYVNPRYVATVYDRGFPDSTVIRFLGDDSTMVVVKEALTTVVEKLSEALNENP